MNISDNLTQEDLQNLLLNDYIKTNRSEELNTQDLLNEIKDSILTICSLKEKRRVEGGL
ncbi:hypothetical protein [Rossellomorea aquimaris]|uniref:hypothetical protein n=1 Tax=Rossellomorea aquimaris TaxID=189382 RepID=UPI000AE22304|nr:hypothetical protein [Rossellomorea aquimaris]